MNHTVTVEEAVRRRRATRHFENRPLPEGVIEKLLEIACHAPSGFNLQPWEFVVVTDAEVRARLQDACLGQKQIAEAPAIVVFLGNTRCWEDQMEKIIEGDRQTGALTREYAALLRKVTRLSYARGAFGVTGVVKTLLLALARLFRPIPRLCLTQGQRRLWTFLQVGLCAQTFMLAAAAEGLDTCPMEGFAEGRVRRVVNAPTHYAVVVVVAVGHGKTDQSPKRARLPASEKIHANRFA